MAILEDLELVLLKEIEEETIASVGEIEMNIIEDALQLALEAIEIEVKLHQNKKIAVHSSLKAHNPVLTKILRFPFIKTKPVRIPARLDFHFTILHKDSQLHSKNLTKLRGKNRLNNTILVI